MPEIIVLDTHIWIWFVNLQWEQFPTAWVEAIVQRDRSRSLSRNAIAPGK